MCIGQIGYALAPMVARGVMLGPDQPVILHLLDIEPAAQALEGVKAELLDAAFPLLAGGANTNCLAGCACCWLPSSAARANPHMLNISSLCVWSTSVPNLQTLRSLLHLISVSMRPH